MKKIILLAFIFLATAQMSAQDTTQVKKSKFDYRMGVGYEVEGLILLENELNYKMNRFFTSSFSFGYGKAIGEYPFFVESFVQCTGNIFVSPFKNNKKNDFRLGIAVIAAYGFATYQYPNDFATHYKNEFDYGASFIIENTYSISDRFLLGLKIYAEGLENRKTGAGGLIKLGIRL